MSLSDGAPLFKWGKYPIGAWKVTNCLRQQVEVQIHPFLQGHQEAGAPAPTLIVAAQFFANRNQRASVVAATRATGRHQVARLQNPVYHGKGREEQALLPIDNG